MVSRAGIAVRRLNIVHICDHLGWEGSRMHGVKRLFAWMIPRFDASRFNVSLVSLRRKDLSEDTLARQANEVSRIINDIRGFYATDIVGRVQGAGDSRVSTVHNYRQVPGAIPIPATLSIELGKLISSHNSALKYRFISDLPFRGRETHPMDAFETAALATLRADPKATVIDYSGSIFDRTVRIVSPVTLGQACVNCHNSHPDSPKKDWKVGDVVGVSAAVHVDGAPDRLVLEQDADGVRPLHQLERERRRERA